MKIGFCGVCINPFAKRIQKIKTKIGNFFVCWDCRMRMTEQLKRFELGNVEGQTKLTAGIT